MKKINLKVEGMHCVSCAMNIDFDLEDIDGIKSSNTSYAKSICVVEFDEDKVESSDIVASIQKTGYKSFLINEGK